MDWSSAGGWATFAALLLELGLIIWAIAHQFAKFSSKIEDIKKDNKQINTKIEEITKEYKPNSGSSLRDAVNRIETTIKDVQKDVHGVDNRLAKLEGKFEQHVEEAEVY